MSKNKSKDNNKYLQSTAIIKVYHNIYICGLSVSATVSICLFILLFIVPPIWVSFISCLISVIGGVVASFVVAYLIETVKTRKENASIINIVNHEAQLIVDYTNLLFETINDAYFKIEDIDIYKMCSSFPFEKFNPEDDVCLTVLINLSLLSTSVETIMNIDKEYCGNVLPNQDKESFKSFYEGLVEFKNACMYKNKKIGKSIGTLISELSCILFFACKIKYFVIKN